MRLFQWWGGLSPAIRFGVSLLFILASTILWLCNIFWPWGWGVGLFLLIFSFPSKAEKRGYHDF